MNKKILVVMAILLIAVVFYVFGDSKETKIESLQRPGYGEDETKYQLTVKSENREYELELEVEPAKITEEELPEAFEKVYDIVSETLKGDNSSLDCVTTNLNFIETVDEYGMSIGYIMEDYSIIDSLGTVNTDNITQDTTVDIQIVITYDIYSRTYAIPVTVKMPDKNENDVFIEKVEKTVDNMNNELSNSHTIFLPEEIDGQKVTFVAKKESKIILIFLMVLAVFLVWYYEKFTVVKKKQEIRETQMRVDYSEIVSKLSLLMGAGMSGAAAFNKIASDYKASNMPVHYAYEEITVACNRIATGVSEADAYMEFGRACRLHSYIKLAGLMCQNIKKGGEGFTEILKSEVTEAFQERKALAKVAGEEAGTKLLLPMMMMLAIVLAIIMIPAFMSF